MNNEIDKELDQHISWTTGSTALLFSHHWIPPEDWETSSLLHVSRYLSNFNMHNMGSI